MTTSDRDSNSRIVSPGSAPPDGVPRVLLSGCAGFIGARVAELLREDGYRVIGIDNLNDAYDRRLKKRRLAGLLGSDGFEFHHLDIRNGEGLRVLFERATTNGGGARRVPFDAVINLAARAGVRQSVENPWIYVETNLTGTLNLLELCRHHGVRKFVLASTSSVYGRDNPQPFREDAITDAPLSPYAASKKAAEALCYTYHYLYGIDVTIPRYFTVYGPAGRPDMSLFRFVQWISEGRPLHLYGDGRQSRDFTFVDDIARGTCAALRPLGFAIVNLGSDEPIVLADAIGLIEELVGFRARIVRSEAHAADTPSTWADIGRAQALLDWRPRVAFREGVRRLVQWYQENREWARTIITS